jgi:signal transduction histidine kinase
MKKPQVVDLNESIRQTAQLAQAQGCPNRIQLDLKLSAKSPRVLANPAELTEALLNLLTNAIDAYSSIDSSGTIQITSAVIRDHVLVSVMDDAPATESDAQLRLSQPRNLIREIGGDMWISYGETYGTAFIIDLPSAASVN